MRKSLSVSIMVLSVGNVFLEKPLVKLSYKSLVLPAVFEYKD